MPKRTAVFVVAAIAGAAWCLVAEGTLAAAGQSSPGTVTTKDQSTAFDDCMEKAKTNPDWDQCTSAEVERQEVRLAEAWKRAYGSMKKISPRGQKLLLDEQRAWIRYKDATCLYYGSDFGRDGQVLHLGICKADAIATRVDELNRLFEFLKDYGS
jgi:uncharacterized protein YecT (DUF1311 family)